MNSQSDPLAAFRIGKQGVNTSLKAPNTFEEEDSQDPLGQYRIKPPENMQDFTGKNVLRKDIGQGARMFETVLGAPEELRRGIGGLLDLIIGVPAEKISGKKQPELRSFLREPLNALGDFRKSGQANIFSNLPSSEDVKEKITKPLSKKITGDENILEPKNENERFGQEVASDFARLALPGSGTRTWMGKIGLALGGNSTKEIAKQLGYAPSTQELAKFGTLGILSLASLGNAPQFAREYFQNTKAALPRGIRFNTTPLQSSINTIKNSDWYKGHPTPSTMGAREMIKDIEKRIQSGTMGAHEAMTLRENINELANNLGAFSVQGTDKVAHVAHLNEVRDALINGMNQTVGRQYPTWWKQYQDANQAYAITQRSSALGNFIANNYAKPMVSEAGKVLFGNILSKGAAGLAKVGVLGASIASGAKAITLTNRIISSPTLRRYYGNVIHSAARQDGLALQKALSKFDEESVKEEVQEKAKRPLRKPKNI